MTKPWDLKERTMLFALSILRFCRTLPKTAEAAEIADQLRRASSSASAHYWSATRNKSDSDYINKIAGAIEEGDESIFWRKRSRKSPLPSSPVRETLHKLPDDPY